VTFVQRWLKAALITVGLIAVVGLLSYGWARHQLHSVLPVKQALLVKVEPGSSLRAVADDLHAKGAMPHPRLWALYARARGLHTRVKAGEYQLQPGLTPEQLLEKMVSGEVLLRSLTVVEGTSYRAFFDALLAESSLKHTIEELSDEEIMARLGSPGVHPEGQFFPDTYKFAAGTEDLEILKRAHTELRRRLDAAWEGRAPELALQSPYEALVLASIVEKETALAAERTRISGVFLRRLKMGMRLQSDPTVIYGLGAVYDGDIRHRDLRGDTPYNTYTRTGLPPTPIALPGAAAIEAALHPDDSDALYFVATGEDNGSHFFSATLEEHNAAVRRYLVRTRGQQR
jgi:UPF0755 protein